jgi:peroxiredoxin
MKFDKKTLFVAALIGAVVACSAGKQAENSNGSGNWKSSVASTAKLKPEAERNKAADFALKDAEGKVYKLADYKGKVVLVNFWATWCVPCKLEIPWFVDFERQYKGDGFTMLGVSMDEDGWKVVKDYVEKSKINYPVVLGDESTTQKYGGVDALPMSFLVDQQGRIAAVHVGLVERSDYEGEIRALLGTGQIHEDKKAADGSGVTATGDPVRLAANQHESR